MSKKAKSRRAMPRRAASSPGSPYLAGPSRARPRLARPSISVITPWRDHLELADAYFAAIEMGKPDQLIVVDDCSQEPLPFAALRLDEPSGFCTANNRGLELVETDHVLFLNNDVQPLRESWLDEIRAAVKEGELVGRLRYDPHGNVDGQPHPYLDGWCVAATTADIRRLGGWDERYDEAGPSYFSDNAFSLQARLSGLDLVELQPGLRHLTGTTGGHGEAFENALRVNGQLYARQVREALK